MTEDIIPKLKGLLGEATPETIMQVAPEAAKAYLVALAANKPSRYDSFLAGAAWVVSDPVFPALIARVEAAEGEKAGLVAEVERLKDALGRVSNVLQVPAAEYVPAIPDAWSIIDGALK